MTFPSATCNGSPGDGVVLALALWDDEPVGDCDEVGVRLAVEDELGVFEDDEVFEPVLLEVWLVVGDAV